MRVAIYGRMTKNTDTTLLLEFFKHLKNNGIAFIVYQEYASDLLKFEGFSQFIDCEQNVFSQTESIKDVDFLYCIGGDGTLLNSVGLVAQYNIPVVGVNAGRLGFLASVYQSELIELTNNLKQNLWKEDRRILLEVASEPEPIFSDLPFGLNEVTIHKSNTNEMIVIHTYINGEFLNSYWADGLIISTPTGSTAYSLACGGPIIMPQAENFVLTPIAPHSLTVRPIIVPDTAIISFGIESRSGQALVAIDNRTVLVQNSIALAVKKSEKQIRLVRTPFRSYFTTLRNRLNWGVDARS